MKNSYFSYYLDSPFVTGRVFDVFDVKADALAAIAAANGPFDSARISTDAPAYYHPGRSGVLRLGANAIAYFGELHPIVLKRFGIKQRVVAFEVVLDNIPLPRASVGKAKKKLELSQFQPVDKDMAFILDDNITSDVNQDDRTFREKAKDSFVAVVDFIFYDKSS